MQCFLILTLNYTLSKAQPGQNVSLTINGSNIEIKNGFLGIVIPSKERFIKAPNCPAPIQSFIYNDGAYSDTSFNELMTPGGVLSMNVELPVNNQSQITATITYLFNKKEFQYVGKKYKGGEAGVGYYKCTIIIKKGEKSILIEEDSNYDVEYSVDISNGLWPDKARYRGWSADSEKYGYESPGKVYRSELERGYPQDATVDLDYTRPFKYPNLVLWEPSGGEQNSGRYWQMFNSKADLKANLFGIFQGKPERLIGARTVGVQLQTYAIANNDKATRAAITMNLYRRGPDNFWYSRKRFQWAAFISTKTDLPNPLKQQPIANELNRISGLGTRISLYASQPVRINPSFFKGGIYLSGDQIESLCKKVKTDSLFFLKLLSIDEGYKKIWYAWRYSDSAIALKKSLIELILALKEQYINGEGTYLQKYRYWKGSTEFKFHAITIAALFADKSIKISSEERKKLEQLIGMMARIVWDNNNVPLFDSVGVNLGPNNMPYSYKNSGRMFFALLLAEDAEFKERAKQAINSIEADIEHAIYKNGSAFGTPHYIQPALEPIFFSMLQLRQAGLKDLFSSNKKIHDFAKFYLTLLTPPSVRFNNNRKLVSFGDGSEESGAIFALLATGLKKTNPRLSEELMSSFWYGPPRSSAFGPLALSVDLFSPASRTFSTTTSNYLGYLSHFRIGVNTANETSVWLLNGDSLYDHRNDDAGEIAIYALKAPLSLSRSSFYYPSATDARIRSVVVPEVLFPEWKSKDQPIAKRSLTNRTWPYSVCTHFANLGYSNSVTVEMSDGESKKWFRTVNIITLNEEQPIIAFYDSISGNSSNIWNMLMMSDGAVNTPVGSITPLKKIYGDAEQQLPESTPLYHVNAGLARFEFFGQEWKQHPTKGINWKLYVQSVNGFDFVLADWGTTWQNSLEKAEFYKSNNNPYVEHQQIIRLRNNRPFFNILLPTKKNVENHTSIVKSMSTNTISLEQNGQQIIINPDYYYIVKEKGFCGALLSSFAELHTAGIYLSGGPIEIEIDEKFVRLRLSGDSGIRNISLPFELNFQEQRKGVKVIRSKTGTLITIKYTSIGMNLPNGKRGYQEYVFNRK